MRLIDATEVIKNIVAERDKIPYELVSEKPFKHGNSMRGGIRKAMRCIEQAPTVDAIPVVRCRECKFGTHFGDMEDEWIRCMNLYGNPLMPFDGFCSYGEREEGAE